MKQIIVYDAAGKEQEKINLDLAISKKDESPRTFSYVVKSLLLNWRQGTVSSKSRGEVSFSNKKPWKQKGTGRARAGSLRSPLWRKGGTAFGPQPRTRTTSVNKKQTKLVFNNILNTFLNENKLFCLDYNISKESRPSTKNVFNSLKNLELNNKKAVLFLSFEDDFNFVSFRNIPNLNVISYSQPNVYDITNCDCWIVLKKDLDLFKNMVLSWN
ncbi:50S ribosomal protein L4 [Candidatus Dependentiae bacterium]|nr:50S ribosomal protein L4 [Candidatus Dependentiae bacterium]MBU4387580.1 50S ribosomal protein L4 [Candidatus Dependentiae bacterium]MCG2756298.1 50S ribosomal protein L4 [Candidatus Dependentiae bacterium]